MLEENLNNHTQHQTGEKLKLNTMQEQNKKEYHSKIIPRGYQLDAVDSTSRAFALDRRVLIVAPTASGKSIIIAVMVDRAVRSNPDCRILILCHQGHLLSQNERKIKAINQEIDTGIFCASEGRKEFWNKVVLASRDSLGRNPEVAGKFDLVISDEAHLIDLKAGQESSDTYYSRIIKAQDDPFVVGLTGTPWRLGNGHIVGEDCFFKRLSYEIKMNFLIDEGYLCRYVLPIEKKTIIDTSSLNISSTGDFKEADLDEVSATAEIVNSCLDVWEKEASGRKVSLFFCCSRIHASMVKEKLGKRISPAEVLYIDGDLTGEKRKLELKKIEEGYYRAIVNIGVLTTGFDAPIIDCIVLLRATASASLFVQMGGRGLRLHPGKEDCLMLDMAGNFDRFGSLNEPYVPEKKKRGEGILLSPGGDGMKECPSCGYECSIGCRQCPECLHIFINHTSLPATSGYEYKLHVLSCHFEETQTKAGDFAYIVHYRVDTNTTHKEYLLVNRKEKWADRHRKKWKTLKDGKFDPDIIEVKKKPDSKYPSIKIVKWRERSGYTDNCDHIWIETIWSALGHRTMVCLYCGDPI